MPTEPQVKVGRLAFREEGDLWVAYYAKPDTMDGALYLGSVRMAIITREPKRKEQFIGLMREAVADVLEDRTGVRPKWPEGIQPAPEHERGIVVRNPYLR